MDKFNYTYVGTAYYRSLAEAKKAYYDEADEALAEGRILIGKPPLKEGEKLGVYSDGRYFIATRLKMEKSHETE